MRLLSFAALSALGLAAVKLAGDAAVRRFERTALDDFDPPGRLYQVRGQRFHVVEQGGGPPLVLLHGLGDSIAAWRRNLPVLSRHFRVIAIDLAGHGLSTRSSPDLSLGAQTEAIVSLLDRLGVERATIVGHSMGGSIAQRLATTRPERVERLVLVSSTTDDYMLRASWASRLLAPFIPAFVSVVLNNSLVRRQQIKLVVADASRVPPDLRQQSGSHWRIRGHTRCYQQLMRDRTRDARIDLGAIRAPALVIWGDRDRLVSMRNGERLANAIPDARLVVVANAGHLVPEEQPAEVNRLILEFARAPASTEERQIAPSVSPS